jgi:hypothetical protein
MGQTHLLPGPSGAQSGSAAREDGLVSKAADQLKKAGEGTRKQAEGLGYGVAIMIPWVLNDLLNLNVPEHIEQFLAALALSIAVRIRGRL